MNIIFKIGRTLATLGLIVSSIILILRLVLPSLDPSIEIFGPLIAAYSVILLAFPVWLEELHYAFRRSFITKLKVSIATFGLGLLLPSPLSLLLLLSLQRNTVQKIGIGILSAGGFFLLIATLLYVIEPLFNAWRE